MRNLFESFHFYFKSQELQLFIKNLETMVESETWTVCSKNMIPKEATAFGVDINDNDLFFARVKHENNVLIGKASLRLGDCSIPYKGKELRFGKYEVMCSRLKPSFVKF